MIERVEKTLDDLVKNRIFAEKDKPVYRIILTAVEVGADKEKVKQHANCEKFNEYWNNLEKAKIFKDGKVVFTAKNPAELIIELVLYGLTAYGYVRREEVS